MRKQPQKRPLMTLLGKPRKMRLLPKQSWLWTKSEMPPNLLLNKLKPKERRSRLHKRKLFKMHKPKL